MFVLGLTGPSGAGKSLVAGRFARRGFKVLDADRTARAVMEPGSECVRELACRFGKDVLLPDESLNRKKLAEIAFRDSENVAALNRITHPHIMKRMSQELEDAEGDGYRFAVLDAPALFEAGADRLCNEVLAVTAGREIRIKRIVARDTLTVEEALRRIDAQPNEDFYNKRARYQIRNDGAAGQAEQAADRLADEIIQAYGKQEKHP